MTSHPRPGATAASAVGVVAFAVLALAQIAIPLTDDRATTEWLSTTVVVAFAATTFVLAAATWGPLRAVLASTSVAVATLVVERVGSTTGFPFGEYDYTGALEPTLGGVPAIVPLAWFAMGVPALEVGHAVSRPDRRAGRRPVPAAPVPAVAAVVVGALALTAWDLFLDPQMVEEGYWAWAVDGAYEGIPLSNYAGWAGTGVVVLAVVDRIRPRGPADVALLGLYTWWAVMSTIGFVVFFGRPLVGFVGGVAMGACATLAWVRRRG